MLTITSATSAKSGFVKRISDTKPLHKNNSPPSQTPHEVYRHSHLYEQRDHRKRLKRHWWGREYRRRAAEDNEQKREMQVKRPNRKWRDGRRSKERWGGVIEEVCPQWSCASSPLPYLSCPDMEGTHVPTMQCGSYLSAWKEALTPSHQRDGVACQGPGFSSSGSKGLRALHALQPHGLIQICVAWQFVPLSVIQKYNLLCYTSNHRPQARATDKKAMLHYT